ncbi:hypothetical protein AVEN_265070-1 [Araneus ventricosus]|uniref:Tc1-like transposase DDE domain-containing protein n=1 Tax=Araneus ventricosus TaxID=182803 RepID=A0A4Y2NGM8_ARAVE|nr:hypothetical protein AVEN_265070-1 [Araneus ventricosus]
MGIPSLTQGRQKSENYQETLASHLVPSVEIFGGSDLTFKRDKQISRSRSPRVTSFFYYRDLRNLVSAGNYCLLRIKNFIGGQIFQKAIHRRILESGYVKNRKRLDYPTWNCTLNKLDYSGPDSKSHFSDAMGSDGRISLAFLSGRQKSENYQETLANHLLPFGEIFVGTDWTFHHDKGSIHASKSASQWLKSYMMSIFN